MYDVIIVGAGPGGIFTAYELATKSNLKIAVFEKGKELSKENVRLMERILKLALIVRFVQL